MAAGIPSKTHFEARRESGLFCSRMLALSWRAMNGKFMWVIFETELLAEHIKCSFISQTIFTMVRFLPLATNWIFSWFSSADVLIRLFHLWLHSLRHLSNQTKLFNLFITITFSLGMNIADWFILLSKCFHKQKYILPFPYLGSIWKVSYSWGMPCGEGELQLLRISGKHS